jgi:hypothetical protein
VGEVLGEVVVEGHGHGNPSAASAVEGGRPDLGRVDHPEQPVQDLELAAQACLQHRRDQPGANRILVAGDAVIEQHDDERPPGQPGREDDEAGRERPGGSRHAPHEPIIAVDARGRRAIRFAARERPCVADAAMPDEPEEHAAGDRATASTARVPA